MESSHEHIKETIKMLEYAVCKGPQLDPNPQIDVPNATKHAENYPTIGEADKDTNDVTNPLGNQPVDPLENISHFGNLIVNLSDEENDIIFFGASEKTPPLDKQSDGKINIIDMDEAKCKSGSMVHYHRPSKRKVYFQLICMAVHPCMA